MATPGKQVEEPVPKKVKVTVEDGVVKVSEQPLRLEKDKNHEALWRCHHGDLEIRFSPGDTPFQGHHFMVPKGGACCSGVPIVARNPDKHYKYTVTVTVGGHAYSLDPDVIVN